MGLPRLSPISPSRRLVRLLIRVPSFGFPLTLSLTHSLTSALSLALPRQKGRGQKKRGTAFPGLPPRSKAFTSGSVSRSPGADIPFPIFDSPYSVAKTALRPRLSRLSQRCSVRLSYCRPPSRTRSAPRPSRPTRREDNRLSPVCCTTASVNGLWSLIEWHLPPSRNPLRPRRTPSQVLSRSRRRSRATAALCLPPTRPSNCLLQLKTRPTPVHRRDAPFPPPPPTSAPAQTRQPPSTAPLPSRRCPSSPCRSHNTPSPKGTPSP